MGVITSIWGSPEAVPEQPWSWGSKDGTGFAMWQNDERASQAEAWCVQSLAELRGTLCSKLRDQWLVGMVARQDVRISGCEVGEKGWARPWQASVSTPRVRLHLACSGSPGKTSVGECVTKGHCGFQVKTEASGGQ